VRVRHHPALVPPRLVDDGAHLVGPVLRHAHRVALAQHAAGGAHLDHLGAVLHLVAHRLADLVGAVGGAGAVVVLADVGAEAVVVAVPAGDPERVRGGLDAGAGHHALVDRLLERDVGERRRAGGAHRS
jgi:hypothetical protein